MVAAIIIPLVVVSSLELQDMQSIDL